MKKCPRFLFFLVLLIPGGVRLCPAAPGDADAAFDVPVSGGDGSAHTNLLGLAIHLDGRILFGGDLSIVSGEARPFIARVSAAGILDPAFHPNTEIVRSVMMQSDGHVLITGEFTAVSGVTRNRLARFNPDDTLDAAWNPNANGIVYGIVPQPDGKLIIGGDFTAVAGVTRNHIARLNANGSLDTSFDPNANNTVRTMRVLPGGQILIGGNFTSVGGTPRNRLARLNIDGSLDAAFSPDIGGPVYCVAVLPDGRIFAGGNFSLAGGAGSVNLAVLSTTGTVLHAFPSGPNGIVRTMAVQTDGKVIAGGEFDHVNSLFRGRIARLDAGGTLDSTFNPGADGTVFSAALQADGKVLTGGEFTTIGSRARTTFARLENDPATQSLTAAAPNRIQWLRGGASPEATEVLFELSAGGGAGWTPLGPAVRISGGWELTGLALPVHGTIRGRARAAGGYGNGSSSLLETVADYTFSPLQMWRYAHFGTVDSSGAAADNADPDHDGLENLVEYAFGLNPLAADPTGLPVWLHAADDLILDFFAPSTVSGVTYHVEENNSLDEGTWSTVPNSATPPRYLFDLPASDGPRRYLRLRVTEP